MLRQGLGLLVATGERVAVFIKNAELSVWVLFLCGRVFKRVGFRERGTGVGLSGSSRSEMEVPTIQ